MDGFLVCHSAQITFIMTSIYIYFIAENTTEFIVNSASILLQYHMHSFIGSTFFIRSEYNDGAIFLRSKYTMQEN
jgi:hypothetical protein